MKREKQYITEACRCCRREGWTHYVPYSLTTQEETKPIVVEDLPSGFEAVRADAGSSISVVVREAKEYCQTYGVQGVGFEFNGKTVLVTADSDEDAVVGKWWFDVYGETQAESFAKR